jgi:hypothetical protein
MDRTKFYEPATTGSKKAYVTSINKSFCQRVANMNPNTFGALSPAYKEITKRMQEIGFGTIRDLPIIQGEPQLKEACIIKRRKLARRVAKATFNEDFELKAEHIELFNTLSEIQNGVIACLEVQHGLPCHIDIVENAI